METARLLHALWLCAAALLALVLLRLGRFVASYTRIARGLRSVPEAPHGSWLLGHVLPLLRGTPWELMQQWVAERPPLVRLRIMQRHLVVVGSAEGLKRVFQVRPSLRTRHTCCAHLAQAAMMLWKKVYVCLRK